MKSREMTRPVDETLNGQMDNGLAVYTSGTLTPSLQSLPRKQPVNHRAQPRKSASPPPVATGSGRRTITPVCPKQQDLTNNPQLL